ncbi:MAG: hypothetical protein DRJ38_03595 [Thermoprotei archaeon]|nr:MAG: hypothetical protein DRJ38_03595 [Thermoprotei archaeon]
MSIAEKKERIKREFGELIIENFEELHKDERLVAKAITDNTYTKTIMLIVNTTREVADKETFAWIRVHAERQMLVKRWLSGRLQQHIQRVTVRGFSIYRLVLDG